MSAQFNVHDVSTCKPIRPATLEEIRAASVASCIADRTWGNVFFPLYYGQEQADLKRYLATTDKGRERQRDRETTRRRGVLAEALKSCRKWIRQGHNWHVDRNPDTYRMISPSGQVTTFPRVR